MAEAVKGGSSAVARLVSILKIYRPSTQHRPPDKIQEEPFCGTACCGAGADRRGEAYVQGVTGEGAWALIEAQRQWEWRDSGVQVASGEHQDSLLCVGQKILDNPMILSEQTHRVAKRAVPDPDPEELGRCVENGPVIEIAVAGTNGGTVGFGPTPNVTV